MGLFFWQHKWLHMKKTIKTLNKNRALLNQRSNC